VWSFGKMGMLRWPRDADRLENGNTLIADSRNNRVLEVDSGGRVVWSFKGLAFPFEADRLENGNTLIADNNHKRVIEVNPGGEIVWSFRNFEARYSTELLNGDFETDADGDGLPDGWYPADLNAEGAGEFSWDSAVKRGGERSASARYQGDGRIAWLQVVAVEPDTDYVFSGHVKTQLQSGVVAYQVWFEDELGGAIDNPTTVAFYQGTTEWTKDSLTIHSPSNAAAVQVWCQVVADGQAWFDDVSWSAKGAGGGLGGVAVTPSTVTVVGGAVVVVLVALVFLFLFLRKRQPNCPASAL